MSGGGNNPLEELAARTGRDFPNLLRARQRTAAGLEERRARLAPLPHHREASVVLMGSWGRREVTRKSDDDFMVLINGPDREVEPSIDEVRTVLDQAPGNQGIFGKRVSCDDLVENVGLDRDDNTNLTRRMLFLLESLPATADDVYAAARKRVLSRYLDESIKDYRPPRFLLNDTIRYWRTVTVDFAAKEQAGPEKWGMRNAKLRISRKLLFAGGLLPVFRCGAGEQADMFDFLSAQLDMPPTDRVAQAFLEHEAADPGARALGAYDEFIGLLDDEDSRERLEEVTRATAADSEIFAEVRQLGGQLERGLLALLFETEPLSKLVRDYAIF